MILLGPFLRFFGIGALSNKDEGAQVGAVAKTSTDTGINVTDERAMQVSAVWSCVQYITNSVCSLPLEFYRKSEQSRELLTNHYLNDLFHRSPNQNMKPRDFRKCLTMQLCLWSNAYAEIVWNASGTKPIALIPLRPGRMTPYITGGELTYHYQMDQGVRIYSKKSIMHLKGFSTEGIVGLERNNYARETMGLSVSADMYAASQFRNGGRSDGGRIMFDVFLDPEKRRQIREMYESASETSWNKGRLWILEGGSKYEADTLNPDTMQMIETRKMQLGEIARFWGVPEVLIGAGEKSGAWPASFEQQLLFFVTFTLQDYLDEWEHAIADSLLVGNEKRNVIADHDVTGFIKMDSEAKANLHASWVQNGLKTRNEVRKLNNDPPVPNGDELTVQVNLAPIGQQQETEETKRRGREIMELKQQIIALESEHRALSQRPAEPHVFNITLPEQKEAVVNIDNPIKIDAPVRVQKQQPPIVNIQNDVHVPTQKAPVVNVEPTPVTVEAPDVKITNQVEPAEVNIENNIETANQDRKVTFHRDRSGNIKTAEIEDS